MGDDIAGAQPRRTANTDFYGADLLEIHPHDAEVRGVKDGDWVDFTGALGFPVKLDEALGLNCAWYADILLTLTEQ